MNYTGKDTRTTNSIDKKEATKSLSLNNLNNLYKLYFEEKNLYVADDYIYEFVENTELSVNIIHEVQDI